MSNETRDDERDQLLSLRPLSQTPDVNSLQHTTPLVSLGQEGSGNESLLLCSVKEEDNGRDGVVVVVGVPQSVCPSSPKSSRKAIDETGPSQRVDTSTWGNNGEKHRSKPLQTPRGKKGGGMSSLFGRWGVDLRGKRDGEEFWDASGSETPAQTITYATLDSLDTLEAQGVNIMLDSIEEQANGSSQSLPTHPNLPCSDLGQNLDTSQLKDDIGGQLVVVGETGEPMTYIYIQGEADREGGATDTSTDPTQITIPADHLRLPNITEQLQRAYGDLVLVGAPTESIEEPQANNQGGGSLDNPVLLVSVSPLKLEAETEGSTEGVKEVEKEKDEGRIDEEGEGEGDSTIEERLATRDSLLPPRRTRRCGNPGRLTCPVCNTQFRSGRQYSTHLQVHRDEGVWSCDVCSHQCKSAVELRLHKSQVHTSSRPYSCPSCHLTFSKSLVLEDHVRSVHNKERPLSCTFCPKAFYRPHDLKMHLNLHLGIKTNVCDVCGRQFSHPSNLIRHQRLHTGIKPYVCYTCGKRFKQATLLHKHRANHQSGKATCPLCPATFHSAAALCKHSKQDHKKFMRLDEATRIIRGKVGGTGRRYYCRVCGDHFSLMAELKVHEQQEHDTTSQHLCISCGKVLPMPEVSTHACLTPEEQASDNIATHNISVNTNTHTYTTPLHTQAHTTHSIHPHKPSQPPQQSPTSDSAQRDIVRVDEEDYLVMYINPESENVSYFLKKGGNKTENKGENETGNNKDVEREVLVESEGMRGVLPEETILINVHNDDSGLLLASDTDNLGTDNLTVNNKLPNNTRSTTTTTLTTTDNLLATSNMIGIRNTLDRPTGNMLATSKTLATETLRTTSTTLDTITLSTDDMLATDNIPTIMLSSDMQVNDTTPTVTPSCTFPVQSKSLENSNNIHNVSKNNCTITIQSMSLGNTNNNTNNSNLSTVKVENTIGNTNSSGNTIGNTKNYCTALIQPGSTSNSNSHTYTLSNSSQNLSLHSIKVEPKGNGDKIIDTLDIRQLQETITNLATKTQLKGKKGMTRELEKAEKVSEKHFELGKAHRKVQGKQTNLEKLSEKSSNVEKAPGKQEKVRVKQFRLGKTPGKVLHKHFELEKVQGNQIELEKVQIKSSELENKSGKQEILLVKQFELENVQGEVVVPGKQFELEKTPVKPLELGKRTEKQVPVIKRESEKPEKKMETRKQKRALKSEWETSTKKLIKSENEEIDLINPTKPEVKLLNRTKKTDIDLVYSMTGINLINPTKKNEMNLLNHTKTSDTTLINPMNKSDINLTNSKAEIKVLNPMNKTKIKPGICNVKPSFICPDCGKVFNKQWNYQQHIATHDASLHRYECSQCKLTFAYRSTLNKHMVTHNPTPTVHQCTQCPKQYKSVTSLKQHHKRDHEFLRPYACDLCTKRFFSKSDYKYHMRLHKKEQPYICFACGREFSHVSHLHRHERVHTGERPHKCPLCSKTFIQCVTLKIHLKKHEKMDAEVAQTTDNTKLTPNLTEVGNLGDIAKISNATKFTVSTNLSDNANLADLTTFTDDTGATSLSDVTKFTDTQNLANNTTSSNLSEVRKFKNAAKFSVDEQFTDAVKFLDTANFKDSAGVALDVDIESGELVGGGGCIITCSNSNEQMEGAELVPKGSEIIEGDLVSADGDLIRGGCIITCDTQGSDLVKGSDVIEGALVSSEPDLVTSDGSLVCTDGSLITTERGLVTPGSCILTCSDPQTSVLVSKHSTVNLQGHDSIQLQGDSIRLQGGEEGDLGEIPGAIFFGDRELGGQGGGVFGGGHTAVVTGVDGDCIAIFVQEDLT